MGRDMKGLAFRKTTDAIAAFVKQHGSAAPRRALLCTYDLDPTRFEALVLPELARRRRWFRTLVLADAAALQKQGLLTQRGSSSCYELAPVRLRGPGVFHPKMILLQAGARLLVGVGSGNLTAGGLGGNLEMMLFATSGSVDGDGLARSAMQFLRELIESRRMIIPATAKRFIERVCLSMPNADADGPLLNSVKAPLISQLAAGRPASVERVAVVSPWHSTSAKTDGVEPAVLAAVGNALGARPRVYTQGHRGKAPALGSKIEVRILRIGAYGTDEDVDTSFEGSDDEPPRRPSRLHAKAYLVVGRKQATLWFGSANCTTPALCRAAGQGNVELLARVALDRNALARLEDDLESMFERSAGVLPAAPTPRIAAPRGIVLAGYVESWGGAPRLSIELVEPARQARLRLGWSSRRRESIEVRVHRGATSHTLSREMTARLLHGPDAPPVLWEHLGASAIPFPVSIPCAPASNTPEDLLQDALDDLAARVPMPFRTRSTRGPDDTADENDDEERDRELELLTASEHEGVLDRVAVRIELLRRRVAGSPHALSHYARLVDGLAIAPALRRTLVAHLRQGSRV